MRLSGLLSRARPSGNGWFRMNCPFCPDRAGKEDTKASLGIRIDSGWFQCFRCAAHGRLNDSELALLPDEDVAAAAPAERLEPPDGYVPLAEEPWLSCPDFADARRYLATVRASPVSLELQRELGIGATLEGRYARRIVVPVRLPDGAWIGFVARDWTGRAVIPHLFPRGMAKGSVLFNHRALFVETERPLFAIEGVFDAMHLWPDGSGFLGKPSADQMEALSVARRPVAVCLDGDAHREGWAIAMALRLEGQRAGSIRLPPCVDPDQVPRPLLERAALAAIDAADGECVLEEFEGGWAHGAPAAASAP
jgi:hypothetical protein